MEIIDNTAIKVALPAKLSGMLKEIIPRSEVVQRDYVFYWDYPETCRVVKNVDEYLAASKLCQAIPSPMLRDYDWPGIYKPFDHQKHTASFLSLRQRAFCFNEAGTGKTSAAIWAADYLMKLGLIKRVLVICPLSIMYSAWQSDVFKTAMHRSCGVAHGTKEKRQKIIQSEYEFVVINFDGVNVVQDEIKNGKFDLIIVDEANAYKTPTTKRFKTLTRIITSDTWIWMMTGTPAAQSPVDAFGLAKMISPHRVPKFITAWRDVVMQQITRFKWIPKPDSREKVFSALRPAIRYTKAECLDLPPLVYQTREVEMTPQAVRYYKLLKTQLRVEAAGQPVSAVNAASSLSKLLQISGGAVYTDKRDVVEFDVSPRLSELKDVIDETSNKLIVFVPYVHTIKVVSEFLSSNGVSNEVIRGEVSASDRAHIINKFQTQVDPRVLVIQPQSASHGVTLTAADTVVFWSPVMSVETYLQCVARIDRVGQKNSMTVVHLQGSEVERKVYAMLQGKVDSHQKLVDLYKQEIES
jgi:SNF2 family DNA or RNA helicase